jgi:hypothetical protein
MMLPLLFKAPLKSGPRSFCSELHPNIVGFRAFLFGISIANLAYLIPTMFAILFFLLIYKMPMVASWLPTFLGEGDFAFALSDGRISGVVFGIFIGGLSALVLRRVWVGLFFCSLALFAGSMAVNVGWGIWMGTGLGFWIFQTIRTRKWAQIHSSMRWRSLISMTTIFIIFRYSDFLAINIRSMTPFEVARDNRFFQWIVAGSITLVIDSVLSGIFFYFYFWAKKTSAKKSA